MNAHQKRLIILAALLLTTSAQNDPPVLADGQVAAYARRANRVARDVSAVTHRAYRVQVPLVISKASDFCGVVADDYALILPGYSADEASRKAVYAAARTMAVRYSLVHKKLYICEEGLTARLQHNTPSDPQTRVGVIDLLLANELTRALDDQHFGLGEQFRRRRLTQPASCLRGLMEGHCAHIVDEIARCYNLPIEVRCLIDNWCSGWLPEGGSAEYALVNASDPLRQAGQQILRLLYRSEGPSTIARLFLSPPEQLNDLLNAGSYLERIHALRPDDRGVENALRQLLGPLGLEGWQVHVYSPGDLLGRLGPPADKVHLDLPQLRAGRGMILQRSASAGMFCMLLVHYRDGGPPTLDGLLQCVNAFMLDAASGLGAAYQGGNVSLHIGSNAQIIVRQGRLSAGSRSLFATVSAAGVHANTTMIIAGYGAPLENRSLSQAVIETLARVEQSRHD